MYICDLYSNGLDVAGLTAAFENMSLTDHVTGGPRFNYASAGPGLNAPGVSPFNLFKAKDEGEQNLDEKKEAN